MCFMLDGLERSDAKKDAERGSGIDMVSISVLRVVSSLGYKSAEPLLLQR